MSGALRYGWPLYLVTFVNKVASIALSLLPALLVARETDTATASLALGLVRAGTIAGTLLSGPIADRWGLKPTLLLSLLLSGLGVAAMAAQGALWPLVIGALVAQIGMGMTPMALRLLLVARVPAEHQRQSLGWQRSVTNGALVVSFSLGALLGGEHVGTLLLLDAAGSLLAALLTQALLGGGSAEQKTLAPSGAHLWLPFARITAILGAWRMSYEIYLSASAAMLQRAWGDDGISLYSQIMVMNTVLCALFGVLSARWIDDPRWSVPLGLLLLLVGSAIGVSDVGSLLLVAAGMGAVTLGELLFTATSQFVWMALLPDGPRRSTVFAMATTATYAMRSLGGVLTWPLVVDAERPSLGMALLCLPGLLLCLWPGQMWRKALVAR